jgi:tetratricopeptide (TPR) repeat protein
MSRAPDFQALVAPSVRQRLVELMKDDRHEEALALLYRARSADPDNAELRRSIDHLKTYLIGVYATRLGGLDRVAPPLPRDSIRNADTLLLARYIDGRSSFGDVAELHPLGQLRTLQLLAELYGTTARPTSGTRVLGHSQDAAVPSSARSRLVDEEPVAETAQSGAPPTTRGLGVAAFEDPEGETARKYKDMFERGTAAFVQERYQDAIDAFGACVELRQNDPAATVMLRRSVRGLKSQVI